MRAANKKFKLANGSGVKGFGAFGGNENVEARDIRDFEFGVVCRAD